MLGISFKSQERRTQLHFIDDGTFEFRKLDIEDTFLVERNKDGDIVRGWKHFYRNQFPFAGYKGIPRDQVTLSFDRDIILDPYGLSENDKDNPEKRGQALAATVEGKKQLQGTPAWLSEVGEARRLKILANRSKNTNYNKIVIFLGIALFFELLVILILAV